MGEIQEDERQRLSAAHFANYQEYNKVLRTWFVTFGLGAPSVFLINENLAKTLHRNPWHVFIVSCYLLGCVVQVGIALVNKFIAWHSYDDHQAARPKDTWRHDLCRRLENEFRIDMGADLATALLFVIATVAVVFVFA